MPRQTLARQVIGSAGVLQPLHNLMRDVLLDGALIHMDETVVQVLKEKGKAPISNSYMWVQTGGPPDKPVVLYDYDRSRSASVPTALLEGFKGYLMTDGYDARVRQNFVQPVLLSREHATELLTLAGNQAQVTEVCWRDK